MVAHFTMSSLPTVMIRLPAYYRGIYIFQSQVIKGNYLATVLTILLSSHAVSMCRDYQRIDIFLSEFEKFIVHVL
jgi:hypothetical protein